MGTPPVTDPVFDDIARADGLSEASKKIYVERLSSLVSAVAQASKRRSSASPSVQWCLEHPERCWRLLEARRVTRNGVATPLSAHTLRTTAAAAVATIKRHSATLRASCPPAVLRKWEEILERCEGPAYDRYEDLTPSSRQRAAHIEWSELLRVRDELSGLDAEGSVPPAVPRNALLVLALNSYLRPGRADWGRVRVYREDLGEPPRSPGDEMSDPNYIVVRRGARPEIVVAFNRYKTSSTYKEHVREMPPELVDILIRSLDRQPRSYVITKRDGRTPMTNKEYAAHVHAILKGVFKRDATIDTLRHSFVNAADIGNLTPREMSTLASDMRHSVATLSRYRLRF